MLKIIRKIPRWMKLILLALIFATFIQFFVRGVATIIFWSCVAFLIVVFIMSIINMIKNDF